MNKAQIKITETVDSYKVIFLNEYNAFVEQQKGVRERTINEFASFKGDLAIERKLFDTPATLHEMFSKNLDKDELKWFKGKEGGRWFAKNFKEFRASEKI